MNINGYNFRIICNVTPERDMNGKIVQYQPQGRYKNRRKIALNQYGDGNFCKFRIPANINRCGVYVITVGADRKYVGECENLSSRFNTGYGQISPRNCFVMGQETNCRINKLIFSEADKGREVNLWFLATDDYQRIEKQLRAQLNWPWNKI